MVLGRFQIYPITETFTLIVGKYKGTHLPAFSCWLDRTAEHLANGRLVSLHYHVVFLMFFSDDVLGLTLSLVALCVNFWGPLDKEGVEVVHPVNERTRYELLMAFLLIVAVALSYDFP